VGRSGERQGDTPGPPCPNTICPFESSKEGSSRPRPLAAVRLATAEERSGKRSKRRSPRWQCLEATMRLATFWFLAAAQKIPGPTLATVKQASGVENEKLRALLTMGQGISCKGPK